VANRRSSGEIVRLAKFQVDRPTVDYVSEENGEQPPAPRSAPPTKIGRYTVLDLLGVGGMGVVCTAYDPKLDRKIALKLLRKRGNKKEQRDSTGQARLIREAQALAKLSHPNIVTVHDVDQFEGQVYMAMEYVDGVSLDQWMVRGQRGWREVLEVFTHAARGLAAAHAAGITHRDFKPANVLIGKDGRVLVVDFGLAKSHDDKSQERSGIHSKSDHTPRTTDAPEPAQLRERGSLMDVIGSTQDTKLTQVGRTVGTPAYMAPEQFLGLSVGPETDQFSFGVALFEALYGYLPFPDESREELVERVTEGRVNDTPKDTPVPGWVHRVVLRTLGRKPEDRYASMNSLIAALQADPAKRRRRALLAAGTVVLTVLGTYGVVMGLTPDRDVCTGAALRIDEVWDRTRKATIESAFLETNLPFAADAWTRVEEELDVRTAAWVEHHTEVCEATSVRREQSPALMDVRMACLERRRGELRALVEVFQMPDHSVVAEAVKAVQGLEDSEGCLTMLDRSGAAIDDPVMRIQADEIESMLAQSKARNLSERSQSAIELAKEALSRARALGHRPTLARAAMHHATLRAENVTDADAGEIRDNLIEATSIAEETDQFDLEVEGWSKLILFDGGTRGHPEAGLALRIPAEMALRRGGGVRAEAALEQATGAVLHANQDHQAALEAQKRALEKWRAAVGEQHTSVAGVLSNIGAEHAELGQLDEARRYLEEAATIVERLQGPHHPWLGFIHINLGGVLQLQGDHVGAKAHYLAAAEILQRVLPAGDLRTLNAMLGLAQTEEETDPVRAEQRYEDVLSMILAQKLPDLMLLASTQNSLGNLVRHRARAITGDPAQVERLHRKAFQHLTAALETYQRLPGDKRPARKLKLVETNLCRLENERGRLPEALEHCTNAWAHQRAEQGPLDATGLEAVQLLADLQLEHGSRAEAIDLLRKAIAMSTPEESADLRLRLGELWWKHEPSRRTEAMELVSEAELALRTGASSEHGRLKQWLQEHRP
jgi:tRNA A-37 threonylcarbamoyl transferase component Bud32/tetratricopeptide (TPR) repeat protein